LKAFITSKLYIIQSKIENIFEGEYICFYLFTLYTMKTPETTPVILDSYRDCPINWIDESFLWKEMTIAWWIHAIRDHGDLLFIDLREDGEIFQVKFSREVFGDIDKISKLKKESVMMFTWTIVKRSADDVDPKSRTGTIELDCTKFAIISESKPLPFVLHDAKIVSESLRLKYRFLDLRAEKTRKTMVMRSKIVSFMRRFLEERAFMEIETPILGKGTDEWSREFIVPSRIHSGKFYTLPQAPQQYKQMLMASGFSKYFQVAKCFRDEDDKGDRQPEFTQLDLEMAFTSEGEIIQLFSDMLILLVKTYYPERPLQTDTIPCMTYQQAMDDYGTDKPDIRFWLKMKDITHIVSWTSFEVFQKQIDRGWVVKCIKVQQDMTKKQIEDLTKLAIQSWLWWLAYITVQSDYLQSPIVKFLGEKVSQDIVAYMDAKLGDTIFFSAAKRETADKALDIVRRELGKILHLYDDDMISFCWIIDFPMFKKWMTGKWKFTHNPFSLPKKEHIALLMEGKDIEKIHAQQYDITMCGHEIGWGSIRAHLPEILKSTYKVMHYSDEKIQHSIGHMLEAFSYWVPPHGGLALGIDRIMMILQQEKSLREVIAFPKTWSAEDLLFGAPSALSDKTLSDVHIRVESYITTQGK